MHRYFKTKVTYKNATVGQLVVIFNPQEPHGHGPVVKIHWFNKRGAFVGNHYEFYDWDIVYEHHKGKVFTQLRSQYYKKPFGKIRGTIHQFIYESICKISTWFMKKAYVD